MQIKKKAVQEKIYKAAVDIFKEKGYIKTTMKDISSKSGIPVGNIYRYYQNKEVLFDEIVFELYSTLKYIHLHEELGEVQNDFHSKPRKILNTYILLVTSNPKEFSILFDSSVGTKYENTLNELIQIRINKYYESIKELPKFHDLDHDFIFILMKSGISSFIDICKKYHNNEKLLRYYLMKLDYFFRGELNDNVKENILYFNG